MPGTPISKQPLSLTADDQGFIEVVAIKPSYSDVYYYHYIRRDLLHSLHPSMVSIGGLSVNPAGLHSYWLIVWPCLITRCYSVTL